MSANPASSPENSPSKTARRREQPMPLIAPSASRVQWKWPSGDVARISSRRRRSSSARADSASAVWRRRRSRMLETMPPAANKAATAAMPGRIRVPGTVVVAGLGIGGHRPESHTPDQAGQNRRQFRLTQRRVLPHARAGAECAAAQGLASEDQGEAVGSDASDLRDGCDRSLLRMRTKKKPHGEKPCRTRRLEP